MDHKTKYSTTNGSTPVDKINIWFALEIKKLLITEAVEQYMNTVTGCQVMDTGLVNTLTTQPPTEPVQGFLCYNYYYPYHHIVIILKH
jgi:hypothetical protein